MRFCTMLCLAALGAMVPVLRADDVVIPEGLSAAGLVTYWRAHVPLSQDEEVRDVFLVDDQIYLTTNRGFAAALHAPTGALRWNRQITTGGYRLTQPCHAGDRTVFVTPAAIVQYSRLFGQPISQTELRFPAGSGPVSDGQLLYFGGLNRRFYSFALDQDFDTWKAATGAAFTQPAVLRGTSLYAVNSRGEVFAWTAATKVLRWTTRLNVSITAAPVVTADGVFIAAQDQSLYLLDHEFGELRWRARLSSPLYAGPVVVGDTAYQASEVDGIAAIETDVVGIEDRIRWVMPDGRRVLAADEKHAYVYTRSGDIAVVRVADGAVRATAAVPGFDLPLSGGEDLSILLASRDGRVVCMRPRGAKPLSSDALLAALRPPPSAAEPEPPAPAEEQPAARGTGIFGTLDALLRVGTSAPALGGKSKVSREFKGNPVGEATPSAPATPARP